MYVLILIFAMFSSSLLAQNPAKPKVVLGGGNEKIRAAVQNNLSEILHSVTLYSREKKSLEFPPAFTGTPDRSYGISQVRQLADTTKLTFNERVLESELISLTDGSFEIRRIYVLIKDSIYSKEKEMVTTFDPDGYLVGARFALEEHQYDMIVNSATSVEDDYRRKQLISYLERFRTAYNRKDIDFIEQQFSEKALIITGTRVLDAPASPNAPKPVGESPAKFKLIRQTKTEYINNLRNRVFKRASFINVEFEDIQVYQHPDNEHVYGINLKQKWTTSGYSDIGYLFLMIDYTEELKPQIYVRAWQPESMIKAGEKPIELGMFEIIK